MKKGDKVKSLLLKLTGAISAVAPVGIYIAINWEKYAPTTSEGVKLGLGCTLALVVVGLKCLSKIKVPKLVYLWGGVALFSWLMASVLDDLFIISLLAFTGEVGDTLCAMGAKHYDTKLVDDKNALLIAKATSKAIEETKGYGRV